MLFNKYLNELLKAMEFIFIQFFSIIFVSSSNPNLLLYVLYSHRKNSAIEEDTFLWVQTLTLEEELV